MSDYESNVKINVDDSELTNAKKQIDSLKNKKINVTLDVDDKGISKTTDGLSKGLDKATESANNLDTSFKNIAATKLKYDAFKFIEQQCSAATKAVTELNTAMTKVNMTMLDMPESKLNELASQSLDMAKELSTYTKTVTDAVTIYANANESVNGILSKAQPTVLLASASDMQASKAADAIQGIINQFNLADDDAMHVADSIEKLSSEIAVDFSKGIQNISEAVTASGSVMNEAGLSFEKYGAIVSATAEKTRASGSVLGNAYKTIASYISRSKDGEISPEEQAKAERAFNSVGVSLRNTNGEFRELSETLDDLYNVWGNLDNVKRSYIAESVGGVRQKNIFLATMDTYGRALELEQSALNSSGTAIQINEKRVESIDGKMQKLSATMSDMYNDVLSEDAIKGLIDLQTNIVEVVDSLNLLQGAITTLGALGLSSIIGKIASNWGTIAGMLTSPTTLLAVGLGAAVSTFITFEKHQKELMSNAVSKAESSKAAYDQTRQELDSLNAELETTTQRISELQALSDAGTITLAEESELNKLKLQNEELQRQITLKQQLADEQGQASVNDAVKALKLNRTQDLTQDKYMVSETGEEVIAGYVNTGLIQATQNEIKALSEAKDKRNQLIEDYNNAGTEKEKESLDKQITEIDAEITKYENALTENMESVNALRNSFIDQKTNLKRDGLSKEEEGYYNDLTNLIDDFNSIDLSPAERQLKKLDSFFSEKKFIKDELSKSSDSADVLTKALKSMGLSLDDLGIDSIDTLKRYLDEAKSSAEGAAEAIKSLSDTETINAVTTALESQDAGYNYEQAISSAEKIKELYEQGLVGKDEVAAFADYLSYGLDDSLEAYEAGIEKFNRYFTTDSAQGVTNFLEDLTSKSSELGKTWATINDKGGWNFDIENTAEVAKAMGMGVAEIEDIFGRLQDYGFDIEWHSAIGDLNEYKDSLEGVREIYESMNEGVAKERLGKMLEQWDAEYNGFQQDMSTLTDDKIVKIKFEYDITSILQEIESIQQKWDEGDRSAETGASLNAAKRAYREKREEQTGYDESNSGGYAAASEKILSLQKSFNDNMTEDARASVQNQISAIYEMQNAFQDAFSNGNTPDWETFLGSSDARKVMDEIMSQTKMNAKEVANLFDLDESVFGITHIKLEGEIDQKDLESQIQDMTFGSTITFNADINGAEKEVNVIKNIDGSVTYSALVDGVPTEVEPVKHQDGTISYEPITNKVDEEVSKTDGGTRETDFIPNSSAVDAETSKTDGGNRTTVYSANTSGLPEWFAPVTRVVNYVAGAISGFFGGHGLNGTARSGGGAKMDKASHGHAYASGTLGDTSWLKDEWKTKKDNVALTGEVAPELMVNPKTNTWETIGDNGAEFRHIPSGAIIFNAKQTKELLSKGFTKSRGRSMLHGTAYAGGMNGSGKFHGGASSYNSGGGSSSNSTPITTDTSKSIDDATDSAEEFSEELDEIEIKIDRIERAIKNIEITAESAFETYATRNNALKEQISAVNEEISIQQQGYERYIQQANSVGLDEEYAAKIRDGLIDIETITDETLSENIKKYQEWYNQALDCRDAVNELKETSRELYQQEFDNLSEEYNNILDLLDHRKNILEGYIDQTEAQGYIVSQKYYTELIANEEETLNKLNAKRQELIDSMNNALTNGEIEEGSAAWYEMQQEINSVNEAIQESNTNIIEFGNSIRDIDWDIFDKIQDSISTITTEGDFLIDLMSSKDLFNDKGKITDQGKATMGLHGVNYNTYMSQADEYRKEMEKIQVELSKDPYNQDLIERRRELLELQQESIIAAEDEKQAIHDLVEDGIKKELDSLQDLIDKYTDAISSTKEMYDYQKQISEKQKEINELEKQYMAYKGDNSEEGAANRQKLQNELNDARVDLEETIYEKSIEEVGKLLDELYSEYESVLNMRLDNLDVLITDVINNVNLESSAIRETLESEADSVGYQLTESMNTIWSSMDNALSGGTDKITGVITKYGDNFTNALTSVQTAINNLKNIVQQAVSTSDEKADENINEANKQQQEQTTVSTPPTPEPPKSDDSDKNNGGDGVPKVGDVVTLKAGQQYYSSSWGANPVGSYYAGVPGGVVIDSYSNKKYGGTISNTGSYDVHIKSADGKYTDLGWVRLDQLEGYKSGTDYVDKDKLALVGEGGKSEMILHPDGSVTLSDGTVLTPLRQGTKVLNNAQTTNMFEWSQYSPSDMMSKTFEPKLPDITPATNNTTIQNENHLNIEIDKVLDYNDLVRQLQQDKKFEKLVQEMTIGQAMGHDSYRKYHIRF